MFFPRAFQAQLSVPSSDAGGATTPTATTPTSCCSSRSSSFTAGTQSGPGTLIGSAAASSRKPPHHSVSAGSLGARPALHSGRQTPLRTPAARRASFCSQDASPHAASTAPRRASHAEYGRCSLDYGSVRPAPGQQQLSNEASTAWPAGTVLCNSLSVPHTLGTVAEGSGYAGPMRMLQDDSSWASTISGDMYMAPAPALDAINGGVVVLNNNNTNSQQQLLMQQLQQQERERQLQAEMSQTMQQLQQQKQALQMQMCQQEQQRQLLLGQLQDGTAAPNGIAVCSGGMQQRVPTGRCSLDEHNLRLLAQLEAMNSTGGNGNGGRRASFVVCAGQPTLAQVNSSLQGNGPFLSGPMPAAALQQLASGSCIAGGAAVLGPVNPAGAASDAYDRALESAVDQELQALLNVKHNLVCRKAASACSAAGLAAAPSSVCVPSSSACLMPSGAAGTGAAGPGVLASSVLSSQLYQPYPSASLVVGPPSGSFASAQFGSVASAVCVPKPETPLFFSAAAPVAAAQMPRNAGMPTSFGVAAQQQAVPGAVTPCGSAHSSFGQPAAREATLADFLGPSTSQMAGPQAVLQEELQLLAMREGVAGAVGVSVCDSVVPHSDMLQLELMARQLRVSQGGMV